MNLETAFQLSHGVQWLENRGDFPFQHHLLTSMYGVMRAVAADSTGQGKL